MTAPGPTPDRAVLARAEADWRATPPDLAGWVALSRDASRALMAEYDRRGAELDRQRARIAAVLAECERREKAYEPYRDEFSRGALLFCTEIRALLGGEPEASEPTPALTAPPEEPQPVDDEPTCRICGGTIRQLASGRWWHRYVLGNVDDGSGMGGYDHHAEPAAQPQAPITAEDVRAAIDGWNHLTPDEQYLWNYEHGNGVAAFVADYLNRRGERA